MITFIGDAWSSRNFHRECRTFHRGSPLVYFSTGLSLLAFIFAGVEAGRALCRDVFSNLFAPINSQNGFQILFSHQFLGLDEQRQSLTVYSSIIAKCRESLLHFGCVWTLFPSDTKSKQYCACNICTNNLNLKKIIPRPYLEGYCRMLTKYFKSLSYKRQHCMREARGFLCLSLKI